MQTFEEIINPGSLSRVADLDILRKICSRGIPEEPPWIRPRVWKLLMGCLPPQKDMWAAESRKSRDRYYDLATEFLDEVERMPGPTVPLGPRDKLLDSIAKDVDRTQPRVSFFRSFVEPSPYSPLSPLVHGYILSPTDEDGRSIPQRIESAGSLFERLEKIENVSHPARTAPVVASQDLCPLPKTPEIRLSPSMEPEEISETEQRRGSESQDLSVDHSPDDTRPVAPLRAPTVSITAPRPDAIELLSSQTLPKPGPKHSQILLRILYLFSVTHPHQPYTQGLNELLAPLYYALCMDIDEHESIHAEADAFWLFTELIGEMGAVIGEPGDWKNPAPVPMATAPGAPGSSQLGVKGAMADFSRRLKWADIQLWEDLARKSLDPALPYYSYRWIACLLAQDLPLQAVLRIWDTIFAQAPSTPDSNPRLSFLINICTSMLIRIRDRLLRTGNARSHSGGLWGAEYVDADAVISARTGIAPPTAPVPGFESETHGVMGEGFIEGMVLLQAYPLKTIGLDMVIEGAWILDGRMREEELQRSQGPSMISDVGSRLRQRFWNGITNQMTDDESGEEDEDENTEKETDATRKSETASDTASQPRQGVFPSVKLRQYAEAFQSSDTAASVSKASTNLTAAALSAWKSRSTAPQPSGSHMAIGPTSTAEPTATSPLPTTTSHPQTPLPPTEKIRQYAEAIRSSDTVASLSKASTNWTVAALDRWNRPAQPSPLNPESPTEKATPLSPETARSRGLSLSTWTTWGAAKTGALWSKSSPASPTVDSHRMTSSQSAFDTSPKGDNRTSLPVPMRASESVGARRRSPGGSTSSLTSVRDYSPPPRPAHFARPRDSMARFPVTSEVPEPLQEAYNKVLALRTQAPDSPEETGPSLGKSIQNAFATLSGGSPARPPSPPLVPKPAPRPLLLGTAAAKTNVSPSQPRQARSADSRPSSISSNASTFSSNAGSRRSITPTPRTSQTSQTSQATSARPDSPEKLGGPSETERKLTGGAFVPLRNGVGVGRHGPSASVVLARQSMAARQKGVDYSQFESTEPRSPSIVTSPMTSLAGPFSPVLDTAPKKYTLTDKPVSIPEPLAADGYSSNSSAGGPMQRTSRLRTKRTYQAKPLRVVTSASPDSLDSFSPVIQERYAMGDAGPGTQSVDKSRLAIHKLLEEGMRTPTFPEKEERSPPKERSPLKERSPRSPRRVKKVPSHESRDRNDRPASLGMSEEEGARADDEDGYGDLLSAYSEDDTQERPRSFAQ
ncbi:hypothetical protein FRB96_006656 [Tulasnella sp. 330]|nr:hypothetical protein FRB96_006656 [Tulasnella sp. 330]KAG8888439.1 hypothetical protein FRB98_007651 [Tulasnella sp. 332]